MIPEETSRLKSDAKGGVAYGYLELVPGTGPQGHA